MRRDISLTFFDDHESNVAGLRHPRGEIRELPFDCATSPFSLPFRTSPGRFRTTWCRRCLSNPVVFDAPEKVAGPRASENHSVPATCVHWKAPCS